MELPPTYQPSPPPYEPRRASYAYGEGHAPVAQPVIRAQSAPVVAEPVSPMHDEFEAARQASLAAEAERERRLARRRAERPQVLRAQRNGTPVLHSGWYAASLAGYLVGSRAHFATTSYNL